VPIEYKAVVNPPTAGALSIRDRSPDLHSHDGMAPVLALCWWRVGDVVQFCRVVPPTVAGSLGARATERLEDHVHDCP